MSGHVAALSTAQGHAGLSWTYTAGASYTVAEMINGAAVPVTEGTITTEGWSGSDHVTTGSHTYRVTQTVGVFSTAQTITVTVPTAELLSSRFGLTSVAPQSSGASGAELANDVDWVAVSPTRTVLAGTAADEQRAIWLLRPDGSRIRQVTSPESGYDTDAAFSPDGTMLAYTHWPSTNPTDDLPPEVWTVDLTDPNAKATPQPGGASAGDPAWAPDGKRLVVTDSADDGYGQQRWTGLSLLTAGEANRTTMPGTENGTDPGVSRTGQVAFDLPVDTHADVFVTDLAGSQPVQWTHATYDRFGYARPAWSPSGDRLAMVYYTPGGGNTTSVAVINGPGAPVTHDFIPIDPYTAIGQLAWFDAVDLAPTVSVSTPDSTATGDLTATIKVTDPDDADSALTVTCSFDAGPSTPCADSWVLHDVPPGTHTLAVAARDPAGRVTTANHVWSDDTSAPNVRLNDLRRAVLGTSIPVSWTGQDPGSAGIASYQVRVRSIARSGQVGAWQYPSAWATLTTTSVVSSAQAGTQQCFQVRALDKAGNLGAWSTQGCVATPLDDRELNASSGWSRSSSPLDLAGTISRTTRSGATLTLTHVSASRIAVIATRCPGCGHVAVYVDGIRIGTVDLGSGRTHHRRVLWLPPSNPRNGSIVLKAIGRVRIDGLIVQTTAPPA